MPTPQHKPAQSPETNAARNPAELVPLIREDLRQGHEAAEKAGLPYYRAAGEKLLEAKAGLPHGEFQTWIARHFRISYTQAKRYMLLAKASDPQKGPAGAFSSLNDFLKHTSEPTRDEKPPWHEPAKKVFRDIDVQSANLQQEARNRAQERQLQRQLGEQLIDAGYKLLARKLHPDHGGTKDGMTRLNAVRARLKVCLSVH
jgi:hypothetical protein